MGEDEMHTLAATAPSPARITLTCLGTFLVTVDGQTVPHFPTDKVRALLAHLALQPGPHRREALAGLLWPNIGQDYALKNLRNTLHRLRQTLEHVAPDFGNGSDLLFLANRQTIELSRAALDVDAVKLEALLDDCERHRHSDTASCAECLARLAQAADLYRGELLAGFGLADAPAFDEWLLMRREGLHQRMLLALGALTEGMERQGDLQRALTYANRQIALDPYREGAHRQVMRLLDHAGQRHHALAHYDALRHLLREELGAEPDAETAALYDAIHTGNLRSTIYDFRLTERRQTIENRKSPVIPVPILGTRNGIGEKIVNWSGVPDPGPFFGREAELAELTAWLTHDRTRVVGVLGIGGVGKTTLAASAARALVAQFDQVLWQSLLNAPLVGDVLQGWLQALSGQNLTSLPPTLDAQLTLLLDHLRRERCLLVLDNLESILQSDQPGRALPGYEGYDQLIQRIADFEHQGCLIFTSREQPQALVRREGDAQIARALSLDGLDATAARAMLAARGLSGAGGDMSALVRRYSGNPLALKLVAQSIRELFAGDVAAFLAMDSPIFDDIRAVLDQQIARLLPLEREIMTWLAIAREPASIHALRDDFVHPPAMNAMLDAVRALQRRSLMGQSERGLHLQNVVTEYITDVLIEQVSDEILDSPDGNRQSAIHYPKLNAFALLKATAKEAVRASQVRLIVQPIATRLVARLGREGAIERLNEALAGLRRLPAIAPGYGAGNVLNLLLHLGADVRGYDFAGLSVWQAYLQGTLLPEVNFRAADLSRSVFTHIFGEVLNVQFDAGGQLLVASIVDGKLSLLRTDAGQALREHHSLVAGATIANFSPDGRLLASGHTDGSAQVWDVATGQLLHRLEKHAQTPWCLTFSWDGLRLATSGADGSVNVWHASTGQLLRALAGHNAAVPALAFTRDGQTLASADVNGLIHLWDLRPGGGDAPARALLGHTEEVHNLAFDATGEILASGSHDHTVRLWEVASGEVRHVLQAHESSIRTMAISPDGRTLASGGRDAFVCVWDVVTGQPIQKYLDLGHASIAMAFSPDGQLLAAAALEQVVSLLDLRSGEVADAVRAHSNRQYAIDFSPDGRLLASGGTDGLVRAWDMTDGARIAHTWPGHRGWVTAVAISPAGACLASGSADGTVQLRDLSAGGRLRHTVRAHAGGVEAIAFSPDGRLLASVGGDVMLRVWDVQRGEGVHTCIGQNHTEPMVACAFDPCGDVIATGGGDRAVRLWDARTGELARVLRGHSNGVKCLAFSPDGRILASGSYDHAICLWDPRSGQRVSTLQPKVTAINALAFNADGSLLAFAAGDHTARIMDWRTGELLHTLRGHATSVECVRFSPDGRTLASCSADETVRLWDVASGDCLCILRAPGPYAGMNITGVTGISSAQKAVLKALGAVEEI
jgi:WD40 repeat protein/DNA-binding SARP family transcriptional activator